MLDVANEMVLRARAALAMRGVVEVVSGSSEGIHFELARVQIVVGKIDGRLQLARRSQKGQQR